MLTDTADFLYYMTFHNDHIFAVIMAGGSGTRFWPRSRESKPKQYLALTEQSTLIQATAARLQGIVSPERMCVVSTLSQKKWINQQLPWLSDKQVIYEPFGCNTAPAVGLAAVHVRHIDPDGVMVVSPADHRISNTSAFIDTLEHAISLVQQHHNALVTLGIPPSFPATGYGYIECGELKADRIFRVKSFREKPAAKVAQEFLESGGYLWNSGLFIWRADTILQAIKKYMPDLFAGLQTIESVIDTPEYENVSSRVYASLAKQSIDYGVMEHADNVLVVKATFDWSDLGSWQEVYRISEKDENGNVIKGRPILKDVRNCYIETGNRIVSLIGMQDIVVVDTPDALLICHREKSQDVKWVVEKLNQKGKKDRS